MTKRPEMTNDAAPSGDAPTGLSLSHHVRADGVAVVRMDVPGESTNTLREGFEAEVEAIFEALRADGAVEAVVFTSGKPDGFIAGADIGMLDRVQTAEQGRAMSAQAQAAMQRLQDFPKPVVAAIHGACLGGGLELALACRDRVVSDHPKTKLGLPECQLGLLPGAGGTQRLPALIGVQAALDLLLTGRQVSARRAIKLGLASAKVHQAALEQVAAARALALARDAAEGTRGRSGGLPDREALTDLALSGNPLGRMVLFGQARKALLAKTRGNYPAQEAILRVVRAGLERGLAAGYDAEAEAFGALLLTPESVALRSIFFATQSLKRDLGTDAAGAAPRSVTCLGVVGAGLMGAGIAAVSALHADLPVRLRDRDAEGVGRGLKGVREQLDKAVRRRKLIRQEADLRMARVQGTTGWHGFERCEVVVEAVFEDLSLKHEILREAERRGGPEVIFASNTSSLPIARIAEASEHPETVVGMHYFSPVPKMPLLEVVTTPKTAPWVVATVVALGKAQGKTVIVVSDGPGFYTTRILGPFLNEAAYLVGEGVPIDRIDDALLDFGFPVGPLKLTDEVGIDVGAKVAGILEDAFGERMRPPPGGLDRLVADGRLGRKSGKGFYRYGGKGKGVDESVYDVLGVEPRRHGGPSADEIAWRCTAMMINEAARCLHEGVLRNERDGDIGAIFGLGFPPFRGGPFHLLRHQGRRAFVDRLRALERDHGPRFSPAPELLDGV